MQNFRMTCHGYGRMVELSRISKVVVIGMETDVNRSYFYVRAPSRLPMGMVTREMQPRFIHSSTLSPVSLRVPYSLQRGINGAVEIPRFWDHWRRKRRILMVRSGCLP
jgi:hypothetical protein